MNNNRGFTLLEVMVAIFIFATGMMAFMAYHAKANSILFDNESAQFAHALAINLAEEINSLSSEDIRELSGAGCFASGGTCQDGNIRDYFDKGGSFINGPFDSWGKYSTSGTFLFYRLIQMRTYSDVTQTSNLPNSQLGLLRHFEVHVGYPNRAGAETKCSNLGTPNCNYVVVPVVRPASSEP
ncbi:MAG: type IV pilus modification PilV family protein [bacterium]